MHKPSCRHICTQEKGGTAVCSLCPWRNSNSHPAVSFTSAAIFATQETESETVAERIDGPALHCRGLPQSTTSRTHSCSGSPRNDPPPEPRGGAESRPGQDWLKLKCRKLQGLWVSGTKGTGLKKTDSQEALLWGRNGSCGLHLVPLLTGFGPPPALAPQRTLPRRLHGRDGREQPEISAPHKLSS